LILGFIDLALFAIAGLTGMDAEATV